MDFPIGTFARLQICDHVPVEKLMEKNGEHSEISAEMVHFITKLGELRDLIVRDRPFLIIFTYHAILQC